MKLLRKAYGREVSLNNRSKSINTLNRALVMGWSSDFMPYIGQVPGKPNQLILAGFSGHGMPLIFLASKEIARMLRDNKTFEETGLPKIFKPTEERLRSKKNDILGT